MKRRRVNCPNCNSLQEFAPKKRIAAGRIETVIRCLICRTEFVVATKTIEEVREKKRRSRNRMLIRRIR